MMKSLIATIIASMVAMLGVSAHAATPLQLSSDVFVEKQIVRADGTRTVVLEKPNLVLPGDNLVFVVKYRNVGTATASNFVVTNPLPQAVAFNGTSDGTEIVSVDGGFKWGALNTLRMANANGTWRAAQRSDVTHIKWNLNQTLTAGAEGKLIFRGIVK
jgi:uncharacterized repeat protein (TIGR01451 family)